MIEHYGKARGLRFPIWPRIQIELWYCPCEVKIPMHVHEKLDSFIIYLFGCMRVTVADKTRDVCGPFRRRQSTGRFTWAVRYIPAGVRHCAEVLGNFAVFINIERCHGKRVSASKDFVLVDEHPAQSHFNRMKQEGLDDVSSFIEAFDFAEKSGLSPKMGISGTRSEFECFTRGFDHERTERVRSNWEFTD